MVGGRPAFVFVGAAEGLDLPLRVTSAQIHSSGRAIKQALSVLAGNCACLKPEFAERTPGPINAIPVDSQSGSFWGGSSNHWEDHGMSW